MPDRGGLSRFSTAVKDRKNARTDDGAPLRLSGQLDRLRLARSTRRPHRRQHRPNAGRKLVRTRTTKSTREKLVASDSARPSEDCPPPLPPPDSLSTRTRTDTSLTRWTTTKTMHRLVALAATGAREAKPLLLRKRPNLASTSRARTAARTRSSWPCTRTPLSRNGRRGSPSSRSWTTGKSTRPRRSIRARRIAEGRRKVVRALRTALGAA